MGEIEGRGLQQRRLFSTPKLKVKRDKPEWRIQAEIISFLHKLQDQGWDFEVEGDMNQGRRNASRAKVTGIKAGTPDMRLLFPGGVLRFVELKAKSGRRSPEQIAYHKRLSKLGFEVVTVKATDERDGVQQVGELMARWRTTALQ